MLALLLYELFFFAIPAAIVILFGVSLFRYLAARRKNRRQPDSVSAEEMKRRKSFLIILSVMMAVLLAAVVGLISLLYLAIAYM